MILRNALVFVIVALFVRKLQAKKYPRSPCPDIFRYGRSDGEDVGFLTINNLEEGENIIKIKLEQAGDIESDYIGAFELNPKYNESSYTVETGSSVTYTVKFAIENVIPNVLSIRLNGVKLCSGRKIPKPNTLVTWVHEIEASDPLESHEKNIQQKTTTAKPQTRKPSSRTTTYPINPSPQSPLTRSFLDYKLGELKTNNDNSNNAYGPRTTKKSSTTQTPFYNLAEPPTGPQSGLSRSFLDYKLGELNTNNDYSNNAYGPRTTKKSSTTETPFNFVAEPRVSFIQRPKEWQYMNSVCGLENFNHTITKLVIDGISVQRSRFPWIVALYLRNSLGVSFQCGGSLITTRTVISAAHCFYLKNNVLIESDILVSLGRHNINEWSNSDTIVNSDVEKIIRHPDYRPELDNNDADIAIVRLKDRVKFSVYIRPVCLWDGPLDVDEIEGISAIVVGWGRDENNNDVSTTPKLAKAKIVTELQCVDSNQKFVHHTSNRTLCAGNRDGSGPCTGDSGSGLMIRVHNKWTIRGIVSISLAPEAGIYPCDLKEYVVYADIAQFLGWIYDNSVF